jgi:hypothetical protein
MRETRYDEAVILTPDGVGEWAPDAGGSVTSADGEQPLRGHRR